jgi:uncharacterized protein YutE (UPF0331/DUF86 family)
MDRPTAEKLAQALAAHDAHVNSLCEIVETISDPAERKELRRAIGAIFECSFDLLLPVMRQYPEFDPDKDTEWFKEMKARRAARNAPPESDA